MSDEIDYTEIRDDRIRTAICRLMYAMLDNPDKHGIYPTSRFMWKMETFILKEQANLRVENEHLRANHEDIHREEMDKVQATIAQKGEENRIILECLNGSSKAEYSAEAVDIIRKEYDKLIAQQAMEIDSLENELHYLTQDNLSRIRDRDRLKRLIVDLQKGHDEKLQSARDALEKSSKPEAEKYSQAFGNALIGEWVCINDKCDGESIFPRQLRDEIIGGIRRKWTTHPDFNGWIHPCCLKCEERLEYDEAE